MKRSLIVENNRYYSIDSFKLIAIFCIVCIHTNPFSDYYFGEIDGSLVDMFLIDSISRFAVPYFFMASGFLFILKCTKENNKIYFWKYITNLVGLFIRWVFIYLSIGSFIILLQNITDFSTLINSLGAYFLHSINISLFVYGEGIYSAYHLWFLISLIWSIVIVYFFYIKKKIILLLCLSLIFNFLGLFGQSYSGFLGIEININTRETLFFGLFYTCLGALFSLYLEKIIYTFRRMNNQKLFALIFLLLLIQISERMITYNIFNSNLGEYFISTILLTFFIFLFVLRNPSFGKGTFLTRWGRNSVGIFLIHPLIISVFYLIVNNLDIKFQNSLIFHLVFTPLVFSLSYFIYSLKRYINIEWIKLIRLLRIIEYKR